MQKYFGFAVVLAIVFFVSCSQREEGMGERNNPCDPGGTSWTINATPEISGNIDSGWADFNFSDSTGTVRMHISATDHNLPYDTIKVTLVVHSAQGQVRRLSINDSIFLIDHLKRGEVYTCTLLVADTKAGMATYALSLAAPLVIPLPKPRPIITSTMYDVRLSWPPVPYADEYRVYTSSERNGPYTVSSSSQQSAGGSITVIDTPMGYYPRYYLVSAANENGESFAVDTLLGRRFYDGISTPSISSVSQGSYAKYILVSIYDSYYYSSNPYRYEVYRSIGDTLAFRMVGTATRSGSGSSYLGFSDTVSTTANCYYRIAAVDNSGRSSRWSAVEAGYITRLYAPSVTLSTTMENISLSWYLVSGAVQYKIYRSTLSCTDRGRVFDSTTTTVWNDTVSASDYYYYQVAAVDAAGNEGTWSSCRSGRVVLLSAPANVEASYGTYLHYVKLTWSGIGGATGYIIYRGENVTNNIVPFDTVGGTQYFDTVSGASYFYYQVAAYNKRGVGTRCTPVFGATMQPPTLNVTSTDVVRLSWTAMNAVAYYVYRSSPDSTNFVCIDTTSSTVFLDTLPDYSRYYYRIAARVADGVTGPGAIVGTSRPLTAPGGFTVVDCDNGVRLTWNRVPGADRYQLYRSTSYSSAQAEYRQIVDTSFFDTLLSSQRYWYFVAGIVSNQFTPMSAFVQGGIVSVPLAPINLYATGTVAGISLSWQMPTSSSNATGYRIYRARAYSGPFTFIDSSIAVTYVDYVADSGYYYYQVAAYNSKGTGPNCSASSGKRLTPASPASIRATQCKYAGKIVVSWSVVASVTGYRCYRSTSSTGAYTLIATTSDTSIVDSLCTPNVLYYYRIASYADQLSGSMGSAYNGMRLGPPPAINVTELTSAIQLSWAASAYTVSKYYIYRSSYASGVFLKIDSTTSTTYNDVKPLSGDNFYKVSAVNFDESALSPASAVAHLLGPASPSTITATKGTETGRIVIAWPASSTGTLGYRLYRAPTAAFTTGIILRTTVTGTSFIDTVGSDSMYYYRVKAYNISAESPLSDSVAAGFRLPATVPKPPLNIGCATGGSIYISWEPPPSSVGYTGYRLYRSLNQNGNDSTVVITTASHYTDLTPNSFPTVYWYRVSTYNQKGESALSEAVSGYRN